MKTQVAIEIETLEDEVARLLEINAVLCRIAFRVRDGIVRINRETAEDLLLVQQHLNDCLLPQARARRGEVGKRGPYKVGARKRARESQAFEAAHDPVSAHG